ncbi:hypothetical protein EP7_004839 [Isosphaeraceae bacterium EP7]
MPLVSHPKGDYQFLPGIAPYSCGVVSSPGFEIAHVTFNRPLPYRAGFDAIADQLTRVGRPRESLCSIELRSPVPFTFEGFAAFNAEYASILKGWGLFVDGVNPVARTNVAPVVAAPPEPALYGFAYSRPVLFEDAPTFIVAGAGELPEGVLDAPGIIRGGETSPEAIAAKAEFVLGLMQARLDGLGVPWSATTAVDVYTAHPTSPELMERILGRAGEAAIHGLRWFQARPPIVDIEFEMDLRGVRSELRL